MLKKNNRSSIRLLSIAFFISGGSALIFETVWFYCASLTLGSSVWSAAAVLMAFMGGLAIGNGVIAFKGNRITQPLKTYIVVEVIIGVSGLLAVLVLPFLAPVVASMAEGKLGSPALLAVIRFTVALLILVIPAVAMGITLPILQRALQKYQCTFFSSFGLLYGWNTVGAVFGTLIAEFFLIKFFGILSTAIIACLFNLTAAYIVYKVFVNAQVTETNDELEISEQKPGRKFVSILPVLIPPFVTGFILLALEIIWFRHMIVLYDGTTRVFAIMLAVVLTGIGAGGLISTKLKVNKRDPGQMIVLFTALAGVMVVLSFVLYQQYLLHYSDQLLVHIWWFTTAALVLVLPTCVLSGVLFPLFGEVSYKVNYNSSFSSGMVIFANTVGAALGSCAATFVLLPKLGVEQSVLVLAVVYILISIYYAFLTPKWNKKFVKFAGPVFGLAVILLVFPSGSVFRSYIHLGQQRLSGEWELVTIREGLNETIQYYRKYYFGVPKVHRMLTNSFSMAGTGFTGKRYMRLFAYFPYIFNRDIRSVLQISYGVGTTAEAITSLDSVKQYDIVDISEDVLQLSEIVHSISGVHPLQDSRSKVYIEDGRFYLLSTHNKYDLITGEPPPPKIAHVVNLYTREYFSNMYDRLNEGGMVTYWLPVHQLQPEDTLAIIRAFCDVFKECSLWGSIGLEFMLVGSRGEMEQLTKTRLDELWGSTFSEKLKDIGIESPGQIGAMYLADAAELDRLTKIVKPLTDNYPRRITSEKYNISEYTPLYSHFLNIHRRKKEFEESGFINRVFGKDVIKATLPYFHYENAILSFMSSPYRDDKIYYWDDLVNMLVNTRLEVVPLLYIGSSVDEQKASEVAKEQYRSDAGYLLTRAKSSLVERDYETAKQLFWKYLKQSNAGPNLRKYIFQLYLVSRALSGASDADTLSSAASELKITPPDEKFTDWYVQKFKPGLALANNK